MFLFHILVPKKNKKEDRETLCCAYDYVTKFIIL